MNSLANAAFFAFGALLVLFGANASDIIRDLSLDYADFGLVASMLDNFSVAGLGSAILGAVIVSITSPIASWYIGPDGRYEVFVVRRD